MKFISVLWSTRERPKRDEADVHMRLYSRLAFWRSGVRSGYRNG